MNSAEIKAIGDEFETRLRRVLESVLKSLNESRFSQVSTTETTSVGTIQTNPNKTIE